MYPKLQYLCKGTVVFSSPVCVAVWGGGGGGGSSKARVSLVSVRIFPLFLGFLVISILHSLDLCLFL